MTGQRLLDLTDDELATLIHAALREEITCARLRLDNDDYRFEARADFAFFA